MTAPESAPGDVTVFQAPRNTRIGAYVGIAVLVLLTLRVVITFGFMATIGVVLVALVISQLYWLTLRPRLVAGPDDILVVSSRNPVRIAWKDVQRTEVGPKGTLIVTRGGVETMSRFPNGRRTTASNQPDTEADRAAMFLAARAAWARRPQGDAPRYIAPEPKAKSAPKANPAG